MKTLVNYEMTQLKVYAVSELFFRLN